MDRFPVLTPARPARAEAAPMPPERARLTPWMFVLGLASLATSAVIVGVTFGPFSRGEATTPATDEEDRRAVAVAYVDVEGGIRPLFPAVPGRVIEAAVPEGKEVEAGTVLLRIDDAIAKAKLRAAILEHRAAEERLIQARKLIPQHTQGLKIREGGVAAAKENHTAAMAMANKAKLMLQGGNDDIKAADSKVREALAAIHVAEAQLEQTKMLDPKSAIKLAETEVEVRKEAVDACQLYVDQCRITAPVKGMILRRLVNVGEMLGQTTTRPAIEFCPSGDRIVRAEVEQEFAAKLRVGLPVTISDDVTGSGAWRGEVSRISDWFTQRRAVLLEPMQYNDIRTLEVIIKLRDDTKGALRINQRVRVKLGE